MQRFFLASLISRIDRRDSACESTPLPIFDKKTTDVMNVCRSERVRPRLAVVALAGLLLG